MKDQEVIDSYVSIKDAMEILGFKSRTSINQKVDKGEIKFVTACRGSSSEMRLFSKKDIMRLKRKRERKNRE